MPRKIKNTKKNSRKNFFIKQKLKNQKTKEWQDEVKEFLKTEQQETKITEPNPDETFTNDKEQECIIVNGPLSNPSKIHNFAKLTGKNNESTRFVIPITLQKSDNTKNTNEETTKTKKEEKETKETLKITDETPQKNQTENKEKQNITVIQTKQGPRAVAKCEYKTPKPADTSINELLIAISTLAKLLKNAKNEQTKLHEAIHNADLETCDLLHEIELNEQNETEQQELFKKIKEIRIRRRSYKIKLTYTEELNIFNNSLPTLYTRLINLQKRLTELQEKQTNAKYAPRIRTDIKESDRIQYVSKTKVN